MSHLKDRLASEMVLPTTFRAPPNPRQHSSWRMGGRFIKESVAFVNLLFIHATWMAVTQSTIASS